MLLGRKWWEWAILGFCITTLILLFGAMNLFPVRA